MSNLVNMKASPILNSHYINKKKQRVEVHFRKNFRMNTFPSFLVVKGLESLIIAIVRGVEVKIYFKAESNCKHQIF